MGVVRSTVFLTTLPNQFLQYLSQLMMGEDDVSVDIMGEDDV